MLKRRFRKLELARLKNLKTLKEKSDLIQFYKSVKEVIKRIK